MFLYCLLKLRHALSKMEKDYIFLSIEKKVFKLHLKKEKSSMSTLPLGKTIQIPRSMS